MLFLNLVNLTNKLYGGGYFTNSVGIKSCNKQDQNLTYRCAFRGLRTYNLFHLFSLPT